MFSSGTMMLDDSINVSSLHVMLLGSIVSEASENL